MFSFEPASYGATVASLLKADRLCELGPGSPNQAAHGVLSQLTPPNVVPNTKSAEMAACCLSGLWLWHDFLDESHSISQDCASPEGSYWHAIMHRREPDYSNAKYWYRRVGNHPIFPDLIEQSADIAERCELNETSNHLISVGSWDPCAFVDLCSDVASGRSDAEVFCREVARIEWQLLFDHCYRKAVDG